MNAHDPAEDFVDDVGFHRLLAQQTADTAAMRDVLAKSMAKEPLTPAECAVLLAANEPEQVEEIEETARELKRSVYGNRIVLFAPLYIGKPLRQRLPVLRLSPQSAHDGAQDAQRG